MAENSKTEDIVGKKKFDNAREIEHQASTSRGRNQNPEGVSYNTEDLKVLQYQSADDVRQTMKAIIGQSKEGVVDEDAIQCQPVTVCDEKLFSKAEIKASDRRSVTKSQKQGRPTVLKFVPIYMAKRGYPRGRPPKVGPSRPRKSKKETIRNMYKGKLSNLIPSRPKHRSKRENNS